MLARFASLPQIVAMIEQEERRAVGLTVEGIPVELVAAAPERYGTALLRATGAPAFVAALEPLPDAPDEAGVFAALGLPWWPPELREEPPAGEPPALVEEREIRGDLHCHTTWSDGRASVLEMGSAARDRGYDYVAICDHTPAVGAVRGLTPDDVRRQAEEIAAANEQLAPFRVLRGIECDILPDGRLDLPDDVLAELDWVQASVHGGQRMPRDEMTRRVERALRNPHVRCLSHPTGRMIGRRPENALDLDHIYGVALEEGVALEVNGLAAAPRPERRARAARAAGGRADRLLHRRALDPRAGEHDALGPDRAARLGDERGRRQHPAAAVDPGLAAGVGLAAMADDASQQIDARIEELGDWRGETLSRLRALIKQADPDVVEEWKWRKATNPGVPVWSHDGIVDRRDVQERREAHVLQGRLAGRPVGAVQLEPRGQHAARDRRPRGRGDRRAGVRRPHPSRRQPEPVSASPPAPRFRVVLVNHMVNDPFKALSHPIRRGIVERLAAGPATVGDATAGFGVSKPAISKHLKVLEETGVLAARSSAARTSSRSSPTCSARRPTGWIASAPSGGACSTSSTTI